MPDVASLRQLFERDRAAQVWGAGTLAALWCAVAWLEPLVLLASPAFGLYLIALRHRRRQLGYVVDDPDDDLL